MFSTVISAALGNTGICVLQPGEIGKLASKHHNRSSMLPSVNLGNLPEMAGSAGLFPMTEETGASDTVAARSIYISRLMIRSRIGFQ